MFRNIVILCKIELGLKLIDNDTLILASLFSIVQLFYRTPFSVRTTRETIMAMKTVESKLITLISYYCFNGFFAEIPSRSAAIPREEGG